MDVRLDLRDLPPPEPMERTLEALAVLPAGDRLCIELHREPRPLYDVLGRRGWAHRATCLGEGHWEITIERAR